jgi:hypothetical protein
MLIGSGLRRTIVRHGDSQPLPCWNVAALVVGRNAVWRKSTDRLIYGAIQLAGCLVRHRVFAAGVISDCSIWRREDHHTEVRLEHVGTF